jgi:hypothetical protein
LEPHSVEPAGQPDWQLPATQLTLPPPEGAWQYLLQAPQLSGLFEVSTHESPQMVSFAAMHASPHWPPLHTALAPAVEVEQA